MDCYGPTQRRARPLPPIETYPDSNPKRADFRAVPRTSLLLKRLERDGLNQSAAWLDRGTRVVLIYLSGIIINERIAKPE